MTATALRAMELIVGVAVVVGSLELLWQRRFFADDGVWRWSSLAVELRPLRAVLAYRPFVALLVVRTLAGAALVAGLRGPVVPLLWLTTLAVNLRFRGTFNGGSDLMTMVTLTGLAVAHLGHRSPVVVGAALLYVAAQATLSYFVAGAVKLANAEWRHGDALGAFVARPDFAVPGPVRAAVGTHPRAVVVSWCVIGFEVAFPLAFTSVGAAWAFVALALAFHLANVAAFGLNRFLLAWASTWPAVLWTAHALAR